MGKQRHEGYDLPIQGKGCGVEYSSSPQLVRISIPNHLHQDFQRFFNRSDTVLPPYHDNRDELNLDGYTLLRIVHLPDAFDSTSPSLEQIATKYDRKAEDLLIVHPAMNHDGLEIRANYLVSIYEKIK